MNFSDYTIKNIEETFGVLKTSEKGLTVNEAEKRLKIYGPNEIKAKETGLSRILLRQFKSPFFYLLFIAAIVAFAIGEMVDGWVVLTFVGINVAIGFLQEARAEKAISLLRKYIPSRIKILREGAEKIINEKFLVPGDVILLETGDIFPADLRITEAQNFLVDESVLTGESAPLTKICEPLPEKTKEIFEAKNIGFTGTSVVSGKAKGVIINTGKETVFGAIAKSFTGADKKSIFEKSISEFSRLILKIVVVTIVFLFLINLIIKGTANFYSFLFFFLALIVSIIPEALPVIATFALAEGSLKMAKEKVIIKRLSAIEDLGNIEILCSDKTGTLTQNKLRLTEVFAENKEKCWLYGLLSASYENKNSGANLKNPFDHALFEKIPPKINQDIKNFKTVSEIGFDPYRLRNSVLVKDRQNDKSFIIAKGAPEVILNLCSTLEDGLTLDEVKKETEKMGREGKRILAVAYKEFNQENFSANDEKDMVFSGFFSFEDPLKDTAKETIAMAEKMGVQIKMITGDSQEVASYIAKKINLIQDPQKVILGAQMDSLDEEKFAKTCQEFSVFARVSPETKLKIVQSLQKKFEVAFLGEGINDTPALKTAHVGIAVEEAADVPREASDVILLQKDLRTILDGIKRGRSIFANINKYMKCALASNFGNFYSIAGISLFINFLPMLPIQILLGNLLSDFPLIAVATDTVDPEELKRPKFYQLNRVIPLIISLALVSTIFDFIFFGIFYRIQPAFIQTLWFIESILTEIVLIFLIRTKYFFLKTKRPSWPLMIFALFDAIFIILLPFTNFGKEFFHFVSVPLPYLYIVFSLVFGYLIASEAIKLIYFKYFNPSNCKKA